MEGTMTTSTEMHAPRGRGGADARRALLTGLPVTERRLSPAGISTAVLEGGEGTPLLLLHGPGAYGASWLRVIPELTRSYRVIAPDLPGHGTSSFPDGGLEADRTLSWLEELIEHTCSAPPIIVGQLAGGAIAARFAAGDADRLEQLILVVPFGLAPFQPTPRFGAALTGFLTQPSERTHDELWNQCVFDLEGLRGQPDSRWEQIKAYNLDLAATGNAATAIQALMEAFGWAAIPDDVLARIATPTSLIWGRRDSIVPLAIGEAASTRYGWPLRVIENAGNEPAFEVPGDFVRALRGELAAAPGRGEP